MPNMKVNKQLDELVLRTRHYWGTVKPLSLKNNTEASFSVD